MTSRAGGIYIPPHKLRKMQEEMLADAKKDPVKQQRMAWELLRKSINEIVNKVNPPANPIVECIQHTERSH